MAGPTLIVALDFPDREPALALCRKLQGVVDFFKVGSELFTAAGPAVVRELSESGSRVFLDLKFHDIPATVAGAVAAAAGLGAELVDVHASGGPAMMKAAIEAAARAGAGRRPLVFGITVLTHLADPDLLAMGWGRSSRDQAVSLARLAQQSGLDGVVASAHELEAIREATGGGLALLVPGIRPSWASERHDQSRVATPREAALAGARYVVVGRAITRAPDPRAAAERVREELDRR
jgi:orotidine-5'-phosphate decarboxylase